MKRGTDRDDILHHPQCEPESSSRKICTKDFHSFKSPPNLSIFISGSFGKILIIEVIDLQASLVVDGSSFFIYFLYKMWISSFYSHYNFIMNRIESCPKGLKFPQMARNIVEKFSMQFHLFPNDLTSQLIYHFEAQILSQ